MGSYAKRRRLQYAHTKVIDVLAIIPALLRTRALMQKFYTQSKE